MPSCPVASTILRAKSVSTPSAVCTLAASNPSAAGEISTTSQPLRTGRSTTRLNQSRYSAQSSREIRSRFPPILLAEARLVPGLIGQAGNIEIGPGEMLRAAQRVHAGIGEPRSFPPLLGFVEHEDVAHLRAHQPKRRREARLAGADHEHVQRRPAVRPEPRCKPRSIRMRGLGKIGANLRFEQRSGRSLMPRANRHRPPSRCRS